jgi:hypothetical protein
MFLPGEIRVCGWFILLLHFSIVLLYVSYSNITMQKLQNSFSRNTKNYSVVDAESML